MITTIFTDIETPSFVPVGLRPTCLALYAYVELLAVRVIEPDFVPFRDLGCVKTLQLDIGDPAIVLEVGKPSSSLRK